MLSELVSGKVAAIAVATVLGATTAAAAATGSLPAGAQSAVSHGLSHVGLSVPDGTTHNTSQPSNPPKGPDVSPGAPDLHGLCTAWEHNSAQAKDHSVAMKALSQANGGATGTNTTCTSILANTASSAFDHSSDQSTPAFATPPTGGTGTAATASGGESDHGATTADSASHGASSAGSGNMSTQGASHRP